MNIERVVKDRTQNLVEIKKQKQKCHDEIKQVRNQINEHLDNLEQQILQDLHAAEDKIKSHIDDQLGKLTEHTEKLDLLHTNMSALKEYASDLQTFLGSKMIENEIKKHELFMQSLYKDDSLQKIDLNCKIEDKISDLMSAVTSFGLISVDASSTLVEMQSEKDKQAQIGTLNHAPPTTFSDIKMKLKRKFEFTHVTGCSLSSTGDIFLLDYNQQRLLILNESGTLSEIPLSKNHPLDVTCIDDKTVAVSFYSSDQIQIINILTKTIDSMIKTTSNNPCLCYRDGDLFCCYTSIGIQRENVSGNCSSTLVKDATISLWSFVTTSKDKIMYSNCTNSTVTCCSLAGQKMWEYKDQLIRNPRGIAVDKNSNVYIASSGNNSIIVLSSDGKQARNLLGRDDGINNPFGLAFDVKKEKLLVANYNRPVLKNLKWVKYLSAPEGTTYLELHNIRSTILRFGVTSDLYIELKIQGKMKDQIKTEMASSSTVACGICEFQHTTTNAEYWCPDCDEGLCSQCLKYHNASKALRNHDVISVDNYKQLPPSIANISPYCAQHDRKFKNYCPQHGSIGCPLCIQSNHAKCVGILSLENVNQTAKTSVLMESLDENLKYIKMNADRVVKDRKQNLIEIMNQRQKFHDEIKQLLFEDSSLQKKDLNCKIEDKISDILSTVTSFGSISVASSSPLVVMQTEKDKQAQIGTSNLAQPTTTNDIKGH
ncbi:unnamed protein product [Mytilus edulis]|uniref:B box-type domain-containing protein n=1 Tax=Mytilus edulis TaxID=6550 RepID=A0A8S3RHT0_MYTED|nr:unnamed protein product [Mytilus edulis]